MGKVIRLTENEVKHIISESVKNVLNEIGYRIATLPSGANMKAKDELLKGNLYYGKPSNRRSNMDKLDKSAKINYEALSLSVFDTIGRFTLLFIKPEKERYLSSRVSFHFNEIIFLRDDCFIMQGITEMSKHPIPSSKYRQKPIYVQIQYDFSEEKFYEVVYCANGTIRRKEELILMTAGDVGEQNVKIANALKLHMTNCLYSIEDYKSNI